MPESETRKYLTMSPNTTVVPNNTVVPIEPLAAVQKQVVVPQPLSRSPTYGADRTSVPVAGELTFGKHNYR